MYHVEKTYFSMLLLLYMHAPLKSKSVLLVEYCYFGCEVLTYNNHHNTLLSHLQVVYFTNSGGEANELAMLMARVHTGAFDIVTLRY